MAHNIYFNSITKKWDVMTRGAAWHGLGTVVQDAQTWEDTMRLAGLGVPMVKMQLELHGIPVPNYGIFRKDLLAQGQVLEAFVAPTTETYEIMQDEYMFAFLDTLLESEGAHYEAAGALNNGAQTWALVNLKESFEIVPGDIHQFYLAFTEDRTGNRAARVMLTDIRIVCANTMETAVSADCRKGNDTTITFRHTKSLAEKIQDAADAFTGAKMNINILQEKMRRLNERMVTKDVLESALNRLFPVVGKNAETPQRVQKMLDVIQLFESNDGNQFPEIRGSAYNLLNAGTEYIDHFSPVRRTKTRSAQDDDQIRGERAMFGEGAKLKEAWLDILLEESATAPLRATRKVVGGGGVAVLELEREAATAFAKDDDADAVLLDSILEG